MAIPWHELLLAAVEGLTRFEARRGQRLALMELDDRLLADIDVSRRQARAEARKPFWR